LDIAQQSQHNLRTQAYEHLQRVPMSYFDDHSRTSMVSLLSDDINQIEHVFFACWEGVQLVVAAIALCVLYFVYLSPAYALLIMLSIPALILGSLWLQKYAEPTLHESAHAFNRLRSSLVENLDGIDTIKSFTAEQEELNRIAHRSRVYYEKQQQLVAFTAAYRPIFEFVVMGVTVITLIGSTAAVSSGLTIGTFFLLIMATRQLLWPLTQFGRVLEMAQSGWTSCRRAFELLDTLTEVQDVGAPLVKEEVKGEIVLDDVQFSHVQGISVLRNVNLCIPAGKTVGIVGLTGSGKTTVVKLLLRLYEPDHGALYLDGRALTEYRIRDLRSHIALVSQDAFFFNGTITENITLGSPNVEFAAIENAARAAQADAFIASQPQGYDTVVGERGLRLSAGQRQRLAIARAILKDAPILVLDEATSNIDNNTQALIQRELAAMRRGKTTIIIAHRLTTVNHSDLIYVLRDGHVEQQGTHTELLTEDGLYARLWALQIADEALGTG
jgi:ATP-binding cassette subfamily B protein